MKKTLCIALLLFSMSLSQVFADYYNFSYVDGTFNVSGTLLTAPGSEPFTVIGGSLGDATLYTGSGVVPDGAYYTSPAGAFWYDNNLSPNSTPAITYWGLLFTEGSVNTAGYREINIWGNNGANDYSYEEWIGGNYVTNYNNGTFTVTDVSGVPVPPAILLLGSGLFGLMVMRRRLKK